MSNSNFLTSIWFSTISNHNTNACEAFHSKLNSMFCHSYPHIFHQHQIDSLKLKRQPKFYTIKPLRMTVFEQIIWLIFQLMKLHDINFIKTASKKILPNKIQYIICIILYLSQTNFNIQSYFVSLIEVWATIQPTHFSYQPQFNHLHFQWTELGPKTKNRYDC